jgi:hypothetical protein
MHRTNAKAAKWLNERGYMIYIVPHSRFSKDIFGIADCLAIKDGEVHFIQFKSNHAGNKKELEAFARKHNVNVMLIVFKDRIKEPYIESWNPLPKQ